MKEKQREKKQNKKSCDGKLIFEYQHYYRLQVLTLMHMEYIHTDGEEKKCAGQQAKRIHFKRVNSSYSSQFPFDL